MQQDQQKPASPTTATENARPEPAAPDAAAKRKPATEIGGPPGPEPTRYGDWERKGICVDF